MKPHRELLLKIALGCLGVAAAAGVLAALTGPNEIVWRIIGSTLATALAAGVLAKLDARFPEDGFEWRMVLAASALFYAMALLAIWGIWIDSRIWLSALIVAGGSLVFAGAARFARQSEVAASATIMAGAAALAAPAWLAAVWAPSEKLAVTGTLILGWSAAAASCVYGPKLFAVARWRWLGLAAAAVGFGLCEWLQREGGPHEFVGRLAFVAGVATAAVFHANLCRLAPRLAGWDWLARAAIGLASALALLGSVLALTTDAPERAAPLPMRIALALAIAASAATLALAAAAVFERRRQRGAESRGAAAERPIQAAAAAGTAETLQLECPGCGTPRRAPTGRSACPRCGLSLEWRFVSERPAAVA